MSTLMPLAARAGVPARHFGRAFGLVFSAWGLVGLTAPTAGSLLLHVGGRPLVAIGMLACALAGWLATLAVLRRLRALNACPPQVEDT